MGNLGMECVQMHFIIDPVCTCIVLPFSSHLTLADNVTDAE